MSQADQPTAADYELADRMIGAYQHYISGHHVDRVWLAAGILARTRPAPFEPSWDNPDGPGAA